MLNKSEIETLDQLLENDRLQKQLLQELFTLLLDDDQGISSPAYDTLCELGDAVGLEFDESYRVGSADGRVYLKPLEEMDKIEYGQFYIRVGSAVDDVELWSWAEKQEICTIEHIYYDPEENYVVILPMLEKCLTQIILDQLKKDILLKLF